MKKIWKRCDRRSRLEGRVNLKASIVIPSYQAKERLRLNLIALNRQTYGGEDVEVIIVDNGSTDGTFEMAEAFPLKYPKKVLRVERNRGIAFGRNTGIRAASGDLLIFHDSDMIAGDSFLSQHLAAHEERDLVVCGLSWKRIYTFYYRDFAPDQLEALHRAYRRREDAPDWAALRDRQQLIPDQAVRDGRWAENAFDLDVDFVKGLKQILREHGPELTDYSLAWRFFITNNLSVARSKVLEVGLLDESIRRYGFEDYDLGIRLYKAGCRVRIRQDIVSAHQEHPVNFSYLDMVSNVNYICEKYNSIYFIDMVLVCGGDMMLLSDRQLNAINQEVNQTLALKGFEEFLSVYLALLQLKRRQVLDPPSDNTAELYAAVAGKIPALIRDLAVLQRQYGMTELPRHLCHLAKCLLNIDLEAILLANGAARSNSGEA